MNLIVHKFGGTSVANAEKIRVAARRAIRAQQDGNQVVMVVSAMGHQTDVLVDLAKQLSDGTVRMLGYNGSIPGPTLRVQQGSEVIVHVTNDGDLDTTVHWHGLRLENKYDGVPHETQQPIPVGGLGSDVTGYIQPGVRKLDGHDVLWFSRARDGSDDYSRMARQKCVMGAMLKQISPQTAVTNFEAIANASSAMISTNIPPSEVDRFISLALKARGQG